MSFIYCITNRITGQKYVGKTTKTVEYRWKEHLRQLKRGKTYLYNSMNFYGVENFSVETLEIVEDTSRLDERECFYISALSTKYPSGFNMSDGGEGKAGRVFTDETRAKMSASRKGVKFSAEHKANLGKAISASRCTSGYPGVSKHENKWRARIRVNGAEIPLGRYDTPEAAAQAIADYRKGL